MCDPSAPRLGMAKPRGSCPSPSIQGAVLVAWGCPGGIAPAQQLVGDKPCWENLICPQKCVAGWPVTIRSCKQAASLLASPFGLVIKRADLGRELIQLGPGCNTCGLDGSLCRRLLVSSPRLLSWAIFCTLGKRDVDQAYARNGDKQQPHQCPNTPK